MTMLVKAEHGTVLLKVGVMWAKCLYRDNASIRYVFTQSVPELKHIPVLIKFDTPLKEADVEQIVGSKKTLLKLDDDITYEEVIKSYSYKGEIVKGFFEMGDFYHDEFKTNTWFLTTKSAKPQTEYISNLKSSYFKEDLYMTYVCGRKIKGTLYIQVCVKFNKYVSRSEIKSMIEDHIHIEPISLPSYKEIMDAYFGSNKIMAAFTECGRFEDDDMLEEATDYSSTDVMEKHKKDIKMCPDQTDTKTSEHQLLDKNNSVIPKRNFKTKVKVYWGSNDMASISKAMDDCEHQFYIPIIGNDGKLWWDGYNGTDPVILDNVTERMILDQLIKLCGNYPTSVEHKKGFIEFRSKLIIIISDRPPEYWYPRSLVYHRGKLTDGRIEHIEQVPS